MEYSKESNQHLFVWQFFIHRIKYFEWSKISFIATKIVNLPA